MTLWTLIDTLCKVVVVFAVVYIEISDMLCTLIQYKVIWRPSGHPDVMVGNKQVIFVNIISQNNYIAYIVYKSVVLVALAVECQLLQLPDVTIQTSCIAECQ